MERAFRFAASSPTGRLAPTPVGAQEHRGHIVGFLVPVKITDEEEVQICSVIIGTNAMTNLLSLGDEERTMRWNPNARKPPAETA